MTKGTMIAAFAAATLLAAGAAVAKPPGGGGGVGGTGLSQGKALGSGGWTNGNPPGFGNSGTNPNFRNGWDTPTGGTPPGWTDKTWTNKHLQDYPVPYGIGKHPTPTTTTP
jgi:hypothetical protein